MWSSVGFQKIVGIEMSHENDGDLPVYWLVGSNDFRVRRYETESENIRTFFSAVRLRGNSSQNLITSWIMNIMAQKFDLIDLTQIHCCFVPICSNNLKFVLLTPSWFVLCRYWKNSFSNLRTSFPDSITCFSPAIHSFTNRWNESDGWDHNPQANPPHSSWNSTATLHFAYLLLSSLVYEVYNHWKKKIKFYQSEW